MRLSVIFRGEEYSRLRVDCDNVREFPMGKLERTPRVQSRLRRSAETGITTTCAGTRHDELDALLASHASR